jgi:hypothetical protein
MKKVPQPSSPVIPPAVAMNTLRRRVNALRLKQVEGEIVRHILFEGRDGRWTMYKGTNLAESLGHLLGVHMDHVKRELSALTKRGWIRRGRNDVGDLYVQLTPAFVEAAELAYQRKEVRRIVGPSTWRKINGDDATIADELHRMSCEMGHVNYRDRVKAAAGILITGVKQRHSSGDESSLCRGRIVTSEVTNRHLELIVGERK